MTIHSTIAIVPSYEVYEFAVPLIERLMPQKAHGFTPHITLLYPFAPVDQLDAACEQLRDLCCETSPFEVTLAGYGRFPKAVYLAIQDVEPLRSVFQTVRDVFPQYAPYDGVFGDAFTPHVTVLSSAENLMASLPMLPNYKPITFTVDRLHVSYGDPEDALPWITHDIVRLGTRLG
jgi:RNA 2',3'-cyclic 3'-phosphodiesterase